MHVMAQAYLAVSPDSRNNWKEFFSSKSWEGNSQKVIARLVKAIVIAEYVNDDILLAIKDPSLKRKTWHYGMPLQNVQDIKFEQ